MNHIGKSLNIFIIYVAHYCDLNINEVNDYILSCNFPVFDNKKVMLSEFKYYYQEFIIPKEIQHIGGGSLKNAYLKLHKLKHEYIKKYSNHISKINTRIEDIINKTQYFPTKSFFNDKY